MIHNKAGEGVATCLKYRMPVSLKQPNNILVLKLSAIGDVVFASAMIPTLRTNYPNARLSWLVEPMAAPLLTENPELDEVIIWPRAQWRDLWRQGKVFRLLMEVMRFRAVLRSRQFDLVLDLQGLFKSAFLAFLTGARCRLGYRSKEPTRFLLTHRLAKTIGPRVGSEHFNLAQQLGLDVSRHDMILSLSGADELRAERESALGAYVVICPFTTRPQKHWIDGHWRELAEILVARGWRVVMLGGPSEQDYAKRLVQGLQIENFVGQTTLRESAALISRAHGVIGVDTGLTHMGIAMAVPTVTIFGSTCPYTETTRENAVVLYDALPCAPCRRNPTCGETYDCMRGISAARVASAFEAVVS